jgi:hypothetical protein
VLGARADREGGHPREGGASTSSSCPVSGDILDQVLSGCWGSIWRVLG